MENHKNNNVIPMEDHFQLGAKTFVVNKAGKILLLKCEGRKTYWDIPGGRIHKGETLENVALRELAEETGITTLGPLRYLGMMLTNIRFKNPIGLDCGLIYALYTATVDECVVELSSEHQSYAWVTKDEVIELIGYMGTESFIKML